MKPFASIAFVFLAALAAPAWAQTTPTGETHSVVQPVRLTELTLRDGSRMYGTIVSENDTEITFRTQSGTSMTVTRAEILSARQVSGILSDGEFQPADPNVTRMFFGPTGRSLKRGQSYIGVYEFIMPFVQFGITDRISIGGGTPLIFFADGDESNRLFWVTPKVQVLRGEKTQIAIGAFHGLAGHDYGGIGYVVGTHGTAASSFTIGVGSGYSSDGGGDPVLMFGAEKQTRRNMKAITENYVWKGGQGLASAGVRFFGERMSTDVAAIVPFGSDGFFIGGLVNFVYIFEK